MYGTGCFAVRTVSQPGSHLAITHRARTHFVKHLEGSLWQAQGRQESQRQAAELSDCGTFKTTFLDCSPKSIRQKAESGQAKGIIVFLSLARNKITDGNSSELGDFNLESIHPLGSVEEGPQAPPLIQVDISNVWLRVSAKISRQYCRILFGSNRLPGINVSNHDLGKNGKKKSSQAELNDRDSSDSFSRVQVFLQPMEMRCGDEWVRYLRNILLNLHKRPNLFQIQPCDMDYALIQDWLSFLPLDFRNHLAIKLSEMIAAVLIYY
ncbi:hypothetical protein K438DRAFT_1779406 [Mycena galopus ATCC 62051]|nr:hypothetical protein K438DRAFT_1779406 [Mycena galopus ATCC 62051]